MELEDHLAFYRNYFKNSKIYKKQKYKNYFILPIIFTLGILYHFISHNVVIIEIVLFYTLISLSRGIFWYFFFDKLTLKKMKINLKS
jgi:hypothetical protein